MFNGMTRLIFAALAFLVIPLSADAADRRLSISEFEELVNGRTLYFDRGGQRFGTEQYFDDKRVIWSFENGTCQFGIWFDNADGQICFIYENQPGSICWDFVQQSDGSYAARSEGSPLSDQLVVRGRDQEPIQCPLPDLGI